MAVASPVSVTNRYAALTTDDERVDDSQYEVSRSARRSAKQQIHQQQQQQQRPIVNNERGQDPRQDQGQGRSGKPGPRRALVGMAPSVSSHGLVAAKKIVRKVFCIGNVASNCGTVDVQRFVETLSVRVFTCFPVVPRRRRDDDDDVDRHAFRLCIAADDRERLLDASKWPESVLIRPWVRIPPSVAAERRAAVMSSAPSQPARSSADNNETMLKVPTVVSTTLTASSAMEQTSPTGDVDTDCTVLYHYGDESAEPAV